MPGSSSQIRYPSLLHRLFGVWYRHFRVYTRNILSNGLPPFVEPLFFLAAIGLGLGSYVGKIQGVPYVQFLAAGIIVPPAMFTAAFECSFGTFIRLDFDKVYDGMVSSSITVKDLLVGEILFAGTKSFFFSAAVLLVITVFGLTGSPMALLAPFGGLLTGLAFGGLSMVVTSFVTNINHFNFYFTGLLTPMFFFSGIIFPLDNLPRALQVVAQLFPLAHSARIVRAFTLNQLDVTLLLDVAYLLAFIALFGYLAVRRLRKKIIS